MAKSWQYNNPYGHGRWRPVDGICHVKPETSDSNKLTRSLFHQPRKHVSGCTQAGKNSFINLYNRFTNTFSQPRRALLSGAVAVSLLPEPEEKVRGGVIRTKDEYLLTYILTLVLSKRFSSRYTHPQCRIFSLLTRLPN